MMGERQTDQPALFYEFSLERHVSGDHLLRSIDRFVDLGDIREQLRPFYSDTGRPSVDPELMIRMLIVGYCMGIRSERRLCEEVHLNLAYRWFCRLGLGGAVPDHSTFSKNRHGRFRESDLLRKLFESTVARCIAKGLVGGEGFAVDASMIKADANRQNSTPGDQWEPPDDPGHAVREYLAVLDEAAFGGATPVVPKFIATADPASRWTGANGGLAFFAYSDNYLIDLDHAVIVDVEATTSVRQAEVTAARRMIERTQARFGLWPERLAADAGYGDAANLAWLVEEKGIKPFTSTDATGSRDTSSLPQNRKLAKLMIPQRRPLEAEPRSSDRSVSARRLLNTIRPLRRSRCLTQTENEVVAPAPGVSASRLSRARVWSHHDGDHDRRLRPSQKRLAKCTPSAAWRVIVRRALRRAQVIPFFAKLPSCLIGMEACGTSHHWARELVALGHEVRLMPPAYVKPYVKRGKTDAGDAEAICEAVTRPTMRFVPIKSVAAGGAGAAPDARSPRSAAHAARQHDP